MPPVRGPTLQTSLRDRVPSPLRDKGSIIPGGAPTPGSVMLLRRWEPKPIHKVRPMFQVEPGPYSSLDSTDLLP